MFRKTKTNRHTGAGCMRTCVGWPLFYHISPTTQPTRQSSEITRPEPIGGQPDRANPRDHTIIILEAPTNIQTHTHNHMESLPHAWDLPPAPGGLSSPSNRVREHLGVWNLPIKNGPILSPFGDTTGEAADTGPVGWHACPAYRCVAAKPTSKRPTD